MPFAARYNPKDESPLDSSELQDGDRMFRGLNTRDNADTLPEGVLQVAENVRLTPNPAEVRKGLKKMTNSIFFDNTALFLPFTLPASLNDFPSDGIFGTCLFSDPLGDDAEYICMATQSKMYLLSEDQVVSSYNYPMGETIDLGEPVDMFQAGGNVYILRGLEGPNLGLVSLTSSGTVATATTAAPHFLASGMYVRISGAIQPEYNGEHLITVYNPNSFDFTVAPTTSPATGMFSANRVKTPLKWNGIGGSFSAIAMGDTGSGDRIWMPPASFGLLQANRAILQYGRTTVAISDINNVETYDPINGLLTFANGWSDYLVGAHPYQDNQTLIFLRRSVYRLNNVDGDVENISSQLITQQVGCVSGGTIATCGSDVIFLSDQGVFRLQPGNELALRGNIEPLSSPIDPIIRRINFSEVNKAEAQYFNNRYYLAVPLDGATRNTHVLIYNFLINAWESVDTYPAGFKTDFMEVMTFGNQPTIFLISKEGGIYGGEQLLVDEFGEASGAPSSNKINTRLRSRQITYDSYNLKRYSRMVCNADLKAGAVWEVRAYLTNPDSSRVLAPITSATDNNITRPLLISKRGYGIEIEFQNVSGTGRIINFEVSGYEANRKTTVTE